MDLKRKLSVRIYERLLNKGLMALFYVVVIFTQSAVNGGERVKSETLKFDLRVTTQGPLWPPSTIMNGDQDFIMIGTGLSEVAPGIVAPIFDQAVIVSKNTIPPLNSEGVEDFTNQFGAPYKVNREIDLTPGSDDMNQILYSLSIGPAVGNFGGGVRIPKEGENDYNLNMFGPGCPEIFPSESQRNVYKRQSFPLHEVPILGFQGDQVSYDIDTGESFDPRSATDSSCFPNCSGENNADTLERAPITLGKWLSGEAKMKLKLINYSRMAGGYTAARFQIDFKGLIPNAIYTVYAPRKVAVPAPIGLDPSRADQIRNPGPAGMPNIFITDDLGNADFSTVITNPFPAAPVDEKDLRLFGIGVAYNADFQNWGACPARMVGQAGTAFQFMGILAGLPEVDELITVPPAKRK